MSILSVMTLLLVFMISLIWASFCCMNFLKLAWEYFLPLMLSNILGSNLFFPVENWLKEVKILRSFSFSFQSSCSLFLLMVITSLSMSKNYYCPTNSHFFIYLRVVLIVFCCCFISRWVLKILCFVTVVVLYG